MIEQLKTIRFALEGWANHGKWVWPESALATAKKNNSEAIAALAKLEAMTGEQDANEVVCPNCLFLFYVAPPPAQQPQAEAVPDWNALRHSANEWADMAINGLQWLRNIVEGISDPKEALANMERNLKHCREVNDAPAVQNAVRVAVAAPQQAEAVPSDVVRDADVEAAAKKMAEVFDYPWDFMPERGRNNMRENVRAVLDAAMKQGGGV